jgi:formate dehydrogenase (coenzyme F420) alpha subunit
MAQERVVKSACGLCLHQCGIDIHIEGDRIVKVTGTKEHPSNKGVLCPKGATSLDWNNSPNRLKYPLKRQGGEWIRVSWDEALDLTCAKLNETRTEYGAKAVAAYFGMSPLEQHLFTHGLASRFLDIFGTPNRFDVDSMCFRGRAIAQVLTTGTIGLADIPNTKCILLWGCNVRNSAPVLSRQVDGAKANGAKVVVIDPRRTYWAKKADLFLQPRPGSDCSLALGFLNVIITEKLYDRDFVESWTVGFDKLADHVKSYPPERVEQLTSIAAGDIREAARMFAQTKPACIWSGGNSLDEAEDGVQTNRALVILLAVTGNIHVPGGFANMTQMPLNPIGLPERLTESRLGQEKYPFYYMFSFPYNDCLGSLMWEAMRTGEPYPIKSLIIHGGNPVLTFIDTNRVREALSQLDFLVVLAHFMTETARMAHLVLPVATFMERHDVCDFYTKMCNVPYVMMRKRTVQVGECWSDRTIWLELAKRMGYAEFFPWENEDEVLDYILKPSGLTVKKLTEEFPQGLPYGEWAYGVGRNGFRTQSGKIEIYSETMAQFGYKPLPTPKAPSGPEVSAEYPLLLIHGGRQLEYLASRGRDVTRLQKMAPEPLADLHVDTAARYTLKDGDMAVVETKRGSIEIKVRASEDITPGVISISHGWAGANVNILTDYTSVDPISGFPAKAQPCRVRRA